METLAYEWNRRSGYHKVYLSLDFAEIASNTLRLNSTLYRQAYKKRGNQVTKLIKNVELSCQF